MGVGTGRGFAFLRDMIRARHGSPRSSDTERLAGLEEWLARHGLTAEQAIEGFERAPDVPGDPVSNRERALALEVFLAKMGRRPGRARTGADASV